ncbi:MAG: tRNA (adenosine(37)-N6)-threonylcarbamoyltransferase complex ATPase subunit type 1 TsaE [Clostridia bacterium]
MPDYRLPCMLERDTVSLGRKIGALLFPGAFIALYGELGSGKTTFVKSIASGMGIENIVSPTYTYVMEYEHEPLSLYHFDAYRINDCSELLEIGYLDYCYKNGVLIMEWADRISSALPRERLDIQIMGSGRQYRTMIFTPHGSEYTDILKETVI